MGLIPLCDDRKEEFASANLGVATERITNLLGMPSLTPLWDSQPYIAFKVKFQGRAVRDVASNLAMLSTDISQTIFKITKSV